MMTFVGTYGVWAYDQPDDEDKNEHCAALNQEADNYEFVDQSCTLQEKYLCEIPSKFCYTLKCNYCVSGKAENFSLIGV